jgi:hypothetical protein
MRCGNSFLKSIGRNHYKAITRFELQSGVLSVIDSMTISAPAPGVKLVVAKPTNRLGRRSRTMIIIGVDFHLAVQLFWMMRKEWDYEQVKRFGPHAGQPGNRDGVQ